LHWTFECFQKSERASLQQQLSCAIAACETRQVALRQRQEDLAAERQLHLVESRRASEEQMKLAARIQDLELQLLDALKEERRLIDIADKLRSEVSETRSSLAACTQRCETLQRDLLAAHDDKQKALSSASEEFAKRASIDAQQSEADIARAKADADAELKRCLREAAKKFAQEAAENQVQASEHEQKLEALQSSLTEKRRELKCIEKQLADERAGAEAKTAKALAQSEARVKMTIKGLKKELSDSNAMVAEYKRRSEALQTSLLRAQHDLKASEAAAQIAAAQHEAAIRNFQDELEAQRALHNAEMQTADAEQAKLALRVFELELNLSQVGRP
jgi:hypothetical protein